MTLDIEDYAWAGAVSTLNTLLDFWGDDVDLNRQMAELLLTQALLKTAELEG